MPSSNASWASSSSSGCVQEPNQRKQVWLSNGKFRTSMAHELWNIRWGNQETVPSYVTTARTRRSDSSVLALERKGHSSLVLFFISFVEKVQELSKKYFDGFVISFVLCYQCNFRGLLLTHRYCEKVSLIFDMDFCDSIAFWRVQPTSCVAFVFYSSRNYKHWSNVLRHNVVNRVVFSPKALNGATAYWYTMLFCCKRKCIFNWYVFVLSHIRQQIYNVRNSCNTIQ